MPPKKTGNYVTIDLDHFLDGLDRALVERHVENNKLAILSDFEYARKNDREAHWYGPWSRVVASFLSPVCITRDNETRIEGRAFAQHPAIADASDLDEVEQDSEEIDEMEDIAIPSTRYVDYMVVALKHPNKQEGIIVPLLPPSPRLILGIELKNPKRLARRAQSPFHLKTLFLKVYVYQVVEQASHVFGSYRLRDGDDAWQPKVYPSIIICGEWMTYREISMEEIIRVRKAKEEAALELQEKKEGSTYDPADSSQQRNPNARTHRQTNKTTRTVGASGSQPARRSTGTPTPAESGSDRGSSSGKARAEDSVHEEDLEDWAEDPAGDSNLDISRRDNDENGTWTVGQGHSVKAQIFEIFAGNCNPIELTTRKGWRALSLIAQRLTEQDVSGDMFPPGAIAMDKCHFDGCQESNLLKSWMTKEIKWAKKNKKA